MKHTIETLIDDLKMHKTVWDWWVMAQTTGEAELEAEGYTIVRDEDDFHGEMGWHEDAVIDEYRERHPENPEPPTYRPHWEFTRNLEPDDVNELLRVLSA